MLEVKHTTTVFRKLPHGFCLPREAVVKDSEMLLILFYSTTILPFSKSLMQVIEK